MYNPYLNPYTTPFMPQTQEQQVVKVNGENGARAYQMGANSSALLLDASGTIVWLVMSDGAGYRTVTPYDITPHKDTTPDYNTLEQRIERLEGIINDASNSSAARQSEFNSNSKYNEHGENGSKSNSGFKSNGNAKP